jgi:basic membrane protein A
MMTRRKLLGLAAVLLVLAVVAAQCVVVPATPPAAPAPSAGQPAAAAPPASKVNLKLAAIFPGVITDADYNTLGYLAITAVQADLGVETAYSENVAVPDVERVMREYIDNGSNIIFTHGSQFLTQTSALAQEFPDVHFIAESDAQAENPPPNLWLIDRNFQVGFYPIGIIAAKASKTGKIGYLGGLTLPFSYAEVHAIEQAIADQGLTVEFKPVWAGDFNDPTKARQLAEAMMAEDIDVIVGSLNLGMFGLFEAVKANSNNKVLVTAKYTDKTQFAPDNYITSVLYDFAGPLKDIVQRIENGESGGYYPLGFDTGVSVQPLKNTPPELNSEIQQVVKDLQDGKITVNKDITPIEEQ